jgi:hypothetical protein
MHRTPRLLAWIVLALLLVPGHLAWLYFLRGPRGLGQPAILIWGQFVLGAAGLGMLALLRTTPPDAIRLTPRASVTVVVAGTLLLQLAAVALISPPSSDVDRSAINGPVTRVVFAATGWLGDRLPHASDGAVLRAVFAGLAVGAVGLLAAALRRDGESPWYAALLGWSPLLTLSAGGIGQPEAIGVFLIAAALAAAAAHRFKLGGVALALACGVEWHALLLLPFLWRQVHERRSFRAGRRVVLIFLATLAVTFSPALLNGPRGSGPVAGVSSAGGPGEGNALIHESFKSLFGDGDGDDAGPKTEAARDAARLVGLLVVLGMGMLLWQSRATLAEAGYWLFTFGLLFAPGVRPSALLWLLVFVPLVRGPQGFAALTWSATAAVGYMLGRDGDPPGHVPPMGLIAEYLPVLCVLAVEVLRLARVVPLGRAIQSSGPAVPA